MKKLALRSLLVAVLAVCAATAAQAAKIEVCHIPPGNPANWHTITVNTNALPAHQGHGDLVGSCLANCETLCNDGNKCTVDVVPSTTQCLCQAATRPAVDCSDGLSCTTDSCNPAQGCLYTPVVCQAPNPCTASVCSEPEGTCEDTPVVCPTGQTCNANTGSCESTVTCPCASLPNFNEVVEDPFSTRCALYGDGVSFGSPSSVVRIAAFSAPYNLCDVLFGTSYTALPITPEEVAVCTQLILDIAASKNVVCE